MRKSMITALVLMTFSLINLYCRELKKEEKWNTFISAPLRNVWEYYHGIPEKIFGRYSISFPDTWQYVSEESYDLEINKRSSKTPSQKPEEPTRIFFRVNFRWPSEEYERTHQGDPITIENIMSWKIESEVTYYKASDKLYHHRGQINGIETDGYVYYRDFAAAGEFDVCSMNIHLIVIPHIPEVPLYIEIESPLPVTNKWVQSWCSEGIKFWGYPQGKEFDEALDEAKSILSTFRWIPEKTPQTKP